MTDEKWCLANNISHDAPTMPRSVEMDNLERAFREGRIDDKEYDAQMDAIMNAP